MLFWILLAFIAVFSIARFKPLLRHAGTGRAIAVLILRLFALAATAMLIAPVSVPSTRTTIQPARVVVLIDASQSTNTPVRRKLIESLKRELGNRSVLVWEFSESLRPTSLLTLSESAKGSASKLSAAIEDIVEMVKPDEMLVITDGQDTASHPDRRVIETLRKTRTRLSAVLLPSNLPPNLSLSVSPAQIASFAGEKVNFEVKVEGYNLARETELQLRVWDSRKLVFQTRLEATEGTYQTTQTTVTLTPESAGWHRYRFEVSPVAGEAWMDDNSVEVAVWQAPTKLRVLLITGQPNFEFKFAKQAIEEEPNFEWVAIASLPDKTRYQQGSPKLLPSSLQRLEPFHVVAVIAPTPEEFSSVEGKAVQQFVQSGGGLLVTLNELTVNSNGWRFFIPDPVEIASISPPVNPIPEQSDLLGEKFTNLPAAEAVWSVRPRRKAFHVALRVGNKPILVWWQEGLGKVAVLALDGTWMWAMDAAKKGEQPTLHRQFWQTLIRFLADPMKGADRERSKAPSDLKIPQPPPTELSTPPNPERLLKWVRITGGQVFQINEVADWVEELHWTRKESITMEQPLSATPLPYLLLLTALTIEWWLVRRTGLT